MLASCAAQERLYRMEKWKPIAGYEALYEISDHGRVRNAKTGQLRKTQTHKTGYVYVLLCKRGRDPYCEFAIVHRLVALAFIGAPPPNHEVNHKNGIKADNHADNLEWVTHAENVRHAHALGLIIPYHNRKRRQAILTANQVRAIRSEYAAGGASCRTLAEKYGVSRNTIYNAINRLKNYKHIE